MTNYSSRPTGSTRADFLSRHAQVLSIAAFFIICLIVFSLISTAFFSIGNLLNLLRQSSPLLIVAVAMTFVFTTGGIDLSIGSTVALVNALAAIVLQATIPWPIVIVLLLERFRVSLNEGLKFRHSRESGKPDFPTARRLKVWFPAFAGMTRCGCECDSKKTGTALITGAAFGWLQGWFVAFETIPAFIVTLAGLSVLRGVALLMTQGFSIPISSDSFFVQLGRGWLLGVPFPAVIAILAVIAGYAALNLMQFGRHVVAIGANMEAARRAGVPVRQRLTLVYVISGTAAALAGIIIAARLGSGSSNAAVGFELDVIAAVVLGGTSLMGGKGTIVGTVLGALTIAVIGNGLILSHVSPFFTQIVTGLIILVAIWLNTRVFNRLATAVRKT